MSKQSNVVPMVDNDFAVEAPKQSRKLTTRHVGFWDENHGTPIAGKIMFAREVTPTRGPSKGKPKRYYVIETTAAAMVAARKDLNKPAEKVGKGTMVAVWAPPGLDDLRHAGGAEVWVKLNPKSEHIDTGKGNPMKTYDVRIIGRGEPVKVLAFGVGDSEQDEAEEASTIPF